MFTTLFEYSSGRIIAVSRVVFALVFFGALQIDPSGNADPTSPGFQVLAGYLLLAVLLLAVALRSWWWDHRLAWPMLVVDILALLAELRK